LPARIAGPAFVLLHDGLTVATALAPPPPPVEAALDLVLLAGAVLFWAPVLGQRYRLSDALRTVYLFTALPLLDAAAVYLVITGDNAGGLAMITAMIPMGLTAVAVTWNWINREERRVIAGELAAGRGMR
jgi:cytochrome c oxidase assembly factor CtaG